MVDAVEDLEAKPPVSKSIEGPIPSRRDDDHYGTIHATPQVTTNTLSPVLPSNKKPKTRKKRKAGHPAKHRLRSIFRDVQTMNDLPLVHKLNSLALDSDGRATTRARDDASLVQHALQHWKTVANERCGSWYLDPRSRAENHSESRDGLQPCMPSPLDGGSCYFKSTDGHVNTWDFSLKRLNLPLIEHVTTKEEHGGCFVVDSSVRKVLPDSFSRTIPIWATVLNRIVLKYNDKHNCSNATTKDNSWDTNLYTPKGVVSEEEHAVISNLIDDRVETLFRSGAIVNPSKLIGQLTKPLRVLWMNHEGKLFPSNCLTPKNDDHVSNACHSDKFTGEARLLEDYFVIICWNPSRYKLVEQKHNPDSREDDPMIVVQKHQTEWIDNRTIEEAVPDSDRDCCAPAGTDNGYYYTPGAADDHESWARHLTPALFWKNKEALLNTSLNDEEVDALIDVLVRQAKDTEPPRKGKHVIDANASDGSNDAEVYSYSDKIGETKLWIGSRRAGRPPECWSGFDAVLNVTNHEYDGMVVDEAEKEKFYLQLPVEEGKRDRTELERWMPVGLAFLIRHLQAKKRVLVHCAQGKDRSVAFALVLVVMVCPLKFPLKFKPEFTETLWDDLSTPGHNRLGKKDVADDALEEEQRRNLYKRSGLPEAVVKRLLEHDGKERFLRCIHKQLGDDPFGPLCRLANKEGIRIALHLIKQDREVAEPTRATMQKINRFLMSSSIYQ